MRRVRWLCAKRAAGSERVGMTGGECPAPSGRAWAGFGGWQQRGPAELCPSCSPLSSPLCWGELSPSHCLAAIWVRFNPLKNRDYSQGGSVSHWDLQGHPAGRQPSPLEVATGLLGWLSWHPSPLPPKLQSQHTQPPPAAPSKPT